jgi:hypothetical protein
MVKTYKKKAVKRSGTSKRIQKGSSWLDAIFNPGIPKRMNFPPSTGMKLPPSTGMNFPDSKNPFDAMTRRDIEMKKRILDDKIREKEIQVQMQEKLAAE